MWSVVLERLLEVNKFYKMSDLFICEVVRVETEQEAINVYIEQCNNLEIPLDEYDEPIMPLPETLTILPTILHSNDLDGGYYE